MSEPKIEIIDLGELKNHPTLRYGHTGNMFEETIYFFGGSDGKGFFNSISTFDLSKMAWNGCSIRNLDPNVVLRGRHMHSSVVHKGKIYFFGGKSNGYKNDFVIFDLKSKKYQLLHPSKMKGDIPSPRFGHSSFKWCDKYYIFGGYDKNGFVNNYLFEFNFEKLEWKEIELKNNKIPRRYHHAAILRGDEYFIMNGLPINLKTNEVTEVKGAMSKMRDTCYGQKAFLIKDETGFEKIYLYGGRTSKTDQKLMCCFNEKKGFFEKVKYPFKDSETLCYSSLNVFNNKLLFFGGQFKNGRVRPLPKKETIFKNIVKFGKKKPSPQVILDIEKIPIDVMKYLIGFIGDIDVLIMISNASKKSTFCSLIRNDSSYFRVPYSRFIKSCQDRFNWFTNRHVNYNDRIPSKLKKKVENKKLSFREKYFEIQKHKIWVRERKENIEKNTLAHEGKRFFFSNGKQCSESEIKKTLQQIKPQTLQDILKVNKNLNSFNYERDKGTDILKCVFVGDGATGKTCLIYRIVNNEFPQEYVPTIFDNYIDRGRYNKIDYQLSLWDTAGEEDYDNLRALSYCNVDIFIVCFSLVDSTSYENVKCKWNDEIRRYEKNAKIVLVGTKLDLKYDPLIEIEVEECGMHMVSTEQGIKLAKEIKASAYIETSAKLSVNACKEDFLKTILFQSMFIGRPSEVRGKICKLM